VSVTATQPNLQPLYQESVEAVIAALATSLRRGLSETEARARLERDGPNWPRKSQCRPGENF